MKNSRIRNDTQPTGMKRLGTLRSTDRAPSKIKRAVSIGSDELRRAPRRPSARRPARTAASAGVDRPRRCWPPAARIAVNPICAASRTRSAACGTPGLPRPARPRRTPPWPATRPDCGRSTRPPRRRSGRPPARRSLMPPAMLTNTSSPARCEAGALLEHREQQRQADSGRCRSPCAARCRRCSC